MPSQKGNLKDRLRSWMLFLNYKLKLKKQQKEQKKKLKMQKKQVQIFASGKYYSKPKVFGLTILGLFLGLFESQEKKNLKTLEEKVVILEKKLESNILDENVFEQIKSIENDISVIKKSKKKDSKTIERYEKKINNIKKKAKEEVLKLNSNSKNHTIKNESNITNNSQTNDIKNGIKTADNRLKKDVKIENNIIDNNPELRNNNPIKKGVYIPILEIKVFNKDLKKYNKDLKEINSKINETKEYDDFYEYEFLVKQLRLRLNELLNKYDNLKNMPGFKFLEDMSSVKDIDEFALSKSNKKIKDSISWCETILVSIENQKKELLSKRKIISTNKKVENTEKRKPEDGKEKKIEKKDNNKLLELMLADKIIYNNIVKEKRKIARFNRLVSNMNIRQKRHNIFYYTKNLVSSIVNFSLSLFPLSLFKNKIFGGLVSGIMLNNSLRSVRKVLKPDIEISYIYTNFEKEIISTSNYLNKMISICDDSLKQIEDIRNTLYINYGNDISYNSSLSSYIEDLSKIESKIKYEQMTILGMNEDLKIVREKNKQKVKKINSIYN